MKSEINNYFKIENIAALTEAEIDDINIIKKFLLTKFEELGIDFDYETRYIKKTGLKYPMFIPKSLNSYITNEYILLSVKKYTYWCQVIYQLSHELTHCLIYCHNKKEQQKAKWIEETICEAMSLYFLKLFLSNGLIVN